MKINKFRQCELAGLAALAFFLFGCASQPGRQPALQKVTPKVLPTEAKVLILTYHQIREVTPADGPQNREFTVTPENFEKELAELKNQGYISIGFLELADYFSGKFTLPEKPIIISFDDGTAGQYAAAFPLLQQYGFKGTFFVFSNALGRNERYFTWEQLKKMADAGMEVGSHGYYHQYFTKVSGKDLEREIYGSKAMIEENIGRPIYVISYPFGSKNDEVIKMVKDAGYIAARDIVNGTGQKRDDILKLKSYFMTSDPDRLAWILKQYLH